MAHPDTPVCALHSACPITRYYNGRPIAVGWSLTLADWYAWAALAGLASDKDSMKTPAAVAATIQKVWDVAMAMCEERMVRGLHQSESGSFVGKVSEGDL